MRSTIRQIKLQQIKNKNKNQPKNGNPRAKLEVMIGRRLVFDLKSIFCRRLNFEEDDEYEAELKIAIARERLKRKRMKRLMD